MPRIVAVLAFFMASLAGARVGADGPRVTPEQIVAPKDGFRLSDRILLVVDVSGSMIGERLQQAIEGCMLVAGSGVDGFRVGAIAFAGGHARWQGRPECVGHEAGPCNRKCVPSGWAAMPWHHRAISEWLGSLVAKGGTMAAAAIGSALKDTEPNLSVVFVSDGDFGSAEVLVAIAKGQAWRKEHDLSPALIMVWGAGPVAKTKESLREIAKAGHGGFWVHGAERTGPW